MHAIQSDQKAISVETVNQFLARGAIVHNNYQWIDIASRTSPEVVQVLIGNGLEPNTKTAWYQHSTDLITQAVLSGNLELADYLTSLGYSYSRTAVKREYKEQRLNSDFTEREVTLGEIIKSSGRRVKNKEEVLDDLATH